MSADLRLYSLRGSPAMPEVAFVLLEDIFERGIEERWLKAKHGAARFDEVVRRPLVSAGLTKRNECGGSGDLLR